MSPERKRSFMDVLVKILAVIGTVTLILIVITFFSALVIRNTQTAIPSRTVLEIEFDQGIVETNPAGVVSRLLKGNILTLRDIVFALDEAAKDRRVKGVVAHIAGESVAYADVQEIRDAVLRFRKSGKPAVAYSETFGESGPGNSLYYLATAFDSIYLQPSGEVGITGILSMSPFVKNALDSLSIKPQLAAREEYKTAKNLFTETDYTDTQKEMNQTIIDSIHSQLVHDISDARKIDRNTLSNLFSQGPFGAGEALRERLVDALEYRDQVYKRMEKLTSKDVSFLSISRYVTRLNRQSLRRGKAVALIIGDGSIVRGKSSHNPLTESKVMGAQTITAAFRSAIKDRSIGVIVFRVNSPGGSYVASDMIWRETVRAREAGKPVIVTMGAVAGSGGYFVSMSAEKIIAHPSTITGSIGVVGGKMVTRGLFNKLGVTFDHVATDSNATLYSSMHEYTPEQWNFIQSWLDTVYADFVGKVAQGRNLPVEQVRNLAKGRVYTGSEALNLKLVDTLGGYSEAFVIAKRMMGIPQDRKVPVKIFPKKRTWWEQYLMEPERDDIDDIKNLLSVQGFPINFDNVNLRLLR